MADIYATVRHLRAAAEQLHQRADKIVAELQDKEKGSGLTTAERCVLDEALRYRELMETV
jgi:hypothetical protein